MPAEQQQTPSASVPVLLWPPSHTADPSLPRVDLLSFMLDPKKPVDATYQAVEITTDRIFFLRYTNLERETQDWVRRELQECFAEQGCARSISVKEWAKPTTERQTPRLRLRCTKVCGFGFQVNFDMDRQQYYVVRSRGKSGNFLHKCPAPVVEEGNNNNKNGAHIIMAPPPAVVISAPTPPPAAATGTTSFIAPPPQTFPEAASHPEMTGGFGSGSSAVQTHGTAMPPPPPVAEDLAALDDFALLIPTPPQATTHANQHQQQQQQPTHVGSSSTETANMYVAAPAPFAVPSCPTTAPAAFAHPAPVTSSAATTASTGVYFHASQLTRHSAAEQGGELHDMDVSSVDSTDMMIARHFGTTGQQHSGGALSSAHSDNSEMQQISRSATTAASRTQVNNEAEYPTVGSIRSFLSMMTGSINSTMGKAWFGRTISNSSATNNNNRDENMLTANSLSYLNTTNSRREKTSGGGDPMDTVNSALSALSVSGVHTLGTMREEETTAGDGNPFSADFWSPPSPASS